MATSGGWLSIPCVPRRRAALILSVSAAVLSVILLRSSPAHANASISDFGYYRVGTLNYINSSFPGCFAFANCCTAPNCTDFGTTDGQTVNTSDLTAGLDAEISYPSDGEAFTFEAVAPDGSMWENDTLTYSAGGECWAWTTGASQGYGIHLFAGPPNLGGGGSGNCPGPIVQVWAGPVMPCY